MSLQQQQNAQGGRLAGLFVRRPVLAVVINALIETARQQVEMMRQQYDALIQGLGSIATSNQQLAAAIAAPKTVVTPSGATYTARTGVN